MLRRVLDDFGPALAGFQIATSIVGFFGIGAIAKWLVDNWFPFTRLIWTEFLRLAHLPDLNSAEKDSLTTLVFFVPMAISSIAFVIIRKSRDSEEGTLTKQADQVKTRLYAALAGTVFIIVMGQSVIRDLITIVTTRAPKEFSAKNLKDVFSDNFSNDFDMSDIFSDTVQIIVYIFSLLIFVLFFVVFRRIGSVKRERIQKLFNKLSGMSAFMGSIPLTASLFATFTGVAIAAEQLGPIRLGSIILVTVSLFATVYLGPKRLLKTTGVVVALLIASACWDVALWIREAVESMPKS